MSTVKCNDSGSKKHQNVTVVSPKVASWASATVMAMALFSFLSVYWICPKYFVENSETSEHGGALGAVDVVQRGNLMSFAESLFQTVIIVLIRSIAYFDRDSGGFPVYITAAIPFFLMMIAVEFLVTFFTGSAILRS